MSELAELLEEEEYFDPVYELAVLDAIELGLIELETASV